MTKDNNLPINKYGTPRKASHNIYSHQFNNVMLDMKARLDFQYGSFNWEVEMGETVISENNILLFVNVWVNKKIILPISKEYQIKDDYSEITSSWGNMFKEFTKAVNGGLLSKIIKRLVETSAERKKNIKAKTNTQRLEEGRS